MAFKFLVYVDDIGRAALCEGGVYTDDATLRATCEDYRNHDFATAATDCDGPRYELRDSMAGVDANDIDVLASLVEWQREAIRDDSAVTMGFYHGRGYDGREVFAAFWPEAEKLMRYDVPLGSRRTVESCRKGEGAMRLGYDVKARIYGERGADQWTRVEPMPIENLTYEGEAVEQDIGGHYVGIVPVRQPSRHYCGGEVQAVLYRAGYDFRGLPQVSIAYISRDRDGKLRTAIPG